MPEPIAELFLSEYLIPAGNYALWNSPWIGLHLGADSLIALADYAIAFTLLYSIQKRQALPFAWILGLLSVLMVTSGTTHLLAVWTLWHPAYELFGVLKAIAAIVAGSSAIALIQSRPIAWVLPNRDPFSPPDPALPPELHHCPQTTVQIRQLNQDLEAQVAQRTLELENSMVQVRDYVERVTLAMDAAKMGSWDWDLATQTVIWSAYHEVLFGYRSGTSVHSYEDWARRVHPDDLATVEAAIQHARATLTDFSAKYRVIWEDGTVRWVAGFGRFSLDATGEPFRMLGMAQDITDRQHVEASLQLSEERLRLATEAADIGMWFWNLTEDELVWTPRCKTLFGLDPDTEMTYDRFLATLHPDERARTHAAVQQALAQQTEYVIEFRTLWHDGTVRWVISQGRAFYNEQGEPLRMMGMAQDITERKHIEAALQERTHELSQMNRLLLQASALVNQRNQELDQFTNIVSHDLKAPLRAIANLSTWIEEDLADQISPDTQQNLDLLRSRVQRMDGLINGLLDYARISEPVDSGETFPLQVLVDEIVDSLDVPPAFTIQIPAPLPILTTNRLLLSQVLTNLLGNAIKHHDRRDGSVQITVQPQPQGYEFTIADDGPGIAPRDQQRVFEIFQTLASRDQKESTGIGLAIVKKIIEQTGGQVFLDSQLSQGATFRFTWLNSPMGESSG